MLLRRLGRLCRLAERLGDRIIDPLEPDELQPVAGTLRDVVIVAPVTCRQHNPVSPAAAAATTFSLMPPTGSTRPRSDISPVMAVSLLTVRPVSSETAR